MRCPTTSQTSFGSREFGGIILREERKKEEGKKERRKEEGRK